MKLRTVLSSFVVSCALLASLAGAAPALGYVNWSSYLLEPTHSSLNAAATSITPANAGQLAPAWSSAFTASGSGFSVSPVVYDGYVYIGGNNGVFYQLDETTGAVVHSLNLGRELACAGGTYGYGVSSTATVAPDPARGGLPTVYVTGGNGTNGPGGIYLWALDAATLQPVWATDPVTVDTQQGAVGWASPTVANGTISVGIASGCDRPLVQGGLKVFSQADGSLIGTYETVPSGSLGGTIWSTPASDGTSTWVATGNAAQTQGAVQGDSYSIVRLQGANKVDMWTVPSQTGTDNDFGASPTLFTGNVGGTPTPMIGDCNKNGWFYALESQALSSGPVWKYQLAAPNNLCNGGAVWDAGAHELIMGSTQAPNGQEGSIQALSPDDAPASRVIWQSYLPCSVLAVPSEDGAGVLAVVTFSPCSGTATPSLYLYNAHATVSNGSGPPAPQLLATIPLGRSSFSQPAFADGYLFVGSESNLMAYAPSGQSGQPGQPPSPPSQPAPPPPPAPVTQPPSPVVSPSSAPAGPSASYMTSQLYRQLIPSGKAARIRALLKYGRFTFAFKLPAAGSVVIDWYFLPKGARISRHTRPVLAATGRAHASSAGTVRITIRLTSAGRRMLRSARRIRLTAKATLKPNGRAAVSSTRTFTLRR